MDNAYERFLKTMLLPDNRYGDRVSATLGSVIQAEAAYAAAGGRIESRHPAEAWTSVPRLPLTAFSFTDLLSLRQSLPALQLNSPHGMTIVTSSHRAVDAEISAREQPFRMVLERLLAGTPMAADLMAALRSLAAAISARQRHGESPARFLDGLVGRLANDELAAMAAALAMTAGRSGQAVHDPRGRNASVPISAPDGGAQACARVLKNAVEARMRAHLVARACLAFKRGAEERRDAGQTVGSVLDGLSTGLAVMNGVALASGQRDGQQMTLFAQALVDSDSAHLAGYVRALDDTMLREFEQHLPILPAARRRRVHLEIDNAKRGRTAAVVHANRNATAAARYSTVEHASMRAATILARLIDRARADLRNQVAPGEQDAVPHGQRPSAPGELTRMSFDVSAQPDGNYDVSVTARLAREADERPVSLTYNSRIASDLRILKGAFRLES
jgi:hypothetical protein